MPGFGSSSEKPKFTFGKPSTSKGGGSFGTTGFSSAASPTSFGGFKNKHVDVQATTTKASNPTPPVTIAHDISKGPTTVGGDSLKAAGHASITLHFTNEQSLTTMPCIAELPANVKHIVFDDSCSCVTEIAASSAQYTGFLSASSGLETVDMRVLNRLEIISPYFLAYCSNLTSVLFPSSSPSVKQIKEHFLCDTSSLLSIDLSFLCNVDAFPGNFLETSGVVEVDLRPFNKLKSIGSYFLSHCANLTTVQFPPTMTEGVAISSQFLIGCSSLKTVDLEFLRNMTGRIIPEDFLSRCSALESVNLEPLRRTTIISGGFLWRCSSLEEVDLSFCTELKSIGADFLMGCSSLKRVEFPHPATNKDASITNVDRQFMMDCSSLTSIDLTFLSNINHVSTNFMRGCSSLQHVDLDPLVNVAIIDSGFLAGASSVKHISLPFTSLRQIGDEFLSSCDALERVTPTPAFAAAKSVASIGVAFLGTCEKLEHVDLSFLVNITIVSPSFMIDCHSLKQVDLSPLVNVTSVSEKFLFDCHALEEVDVLPLKNIDSIPDFFLSYCAALTKVHNLAALHHATLVGNCFLYMCKSITDVDLSSWTKVAAIGESFLEDCSGLQSLHFPPPRANHHMIVDKGFLEGCTALESIDLRAITYVRNERQLLGCATQTMNTSKVLDKCSASTLKAIVVFPENGSKQQQLQEETAVSLGAKPLVSCLKHDLLKNMIELEWQDTDVTSGPPVLPWSWKHHARHPKGTQLAVLWFFAGLEFGGRVNCENQAAGRLPGEVADTICRHIGTPISELLGAPMPEQSGGFSFAKKKTGMFSFGGSGGSGGFAKKKSL